MRKKLNNPIGAAKPQKLSIPGFQSISELQLAAHTLNSISECISITDSDNIIVYVNRSFQNVYGYEPGELIGKHIRIVGSPRNNPAVYDEILKATCGPGWHGRLINTRKNGEEFKIELRTSVVRNEKNEPVAYFGIAKDLTEQIRTEERAESVVEQLESVNEQLRKSEEELKNSNAAKDKFFSLIAHDLRSPFSAILNLIHSLAEEFDTIPPEDIKYLLGRLDSSSKSFYVLLENLLQWSRIQTGRVEYCPFDFFIYEKINETINLLSNNADNKEIRIVNGVNPSIAVYADEGMIYSVLQNLLSNAIKFSHNYGIITFTSEVSETEVLISIADNGVGIKEENLEKIFRIDIPHTTLGTNNEKGNGLGLIICKEMIEHNKGKLLVRSQPNNGTVFTFSLPKTED